MARTRKLFFALAIATTLSALASACSDATTGPKASFDSSQTCEQQGSNNRC
jgi:hypothetical protein